MYQEGDRVGVVGWENNLSIRRPNLMGKQLYFLYLTGPKYGSKYAQIPCRDWKTLSVKRTIKYIVPQKMLGIFRSILLPLVRINIQDTWNKSQNLTLFLQALISTENTLVAYNMSFLQLALSLPKYLFFLSWMPAALLILTGMVQCSTKVPNWRRLDVAELEEKTDRSLEIPADPLTQNFSGKHGWG